MGTSGLITARTAYAPHSIAYLVRSGWNGAFPPLYVGHIKDQILSIFQIISFANHKHLEFSDFSTKKKRFKKAKKKLTQF